MQSTNTVHWYWFGPAYVVECEPWLLLLEAKKVSTSIPEDQSIVTNMFDDVIHYH